MPQIAYAFTAEDCDAWRKNPTVNPVTKKKINPEAKQGLYKDLEKACGKPKTRTGQEFEGSSIKVRTKTQGTKINRETKTQGTKTNRETKVKETEKNVKGPGVSPRETVSKKALSLTMNQEKHNDTINPNNNTNVRHRHLGQRDFGTMTSDGNRNSYVHNPRKKVIRWNGRTLTLLNDNIHNNNINKKIQQHPPPPLYKDSESGQLYYLLHAADGGTAQNNDIALVLAVPWAAGLYKPHVESVHNSRQRFEPSLWNEPFYDVATGRKLAVQEALGSSGSTLATILHKGVPLTQFLAEMFSKFGTVIKGHCLSDTAAYVPAHDEWAFFELDHVRGEVVERRVQVAGSRHGWFTYHEVRSMRHKLLAPTTVTSYQNRLKHTKHYDECVPKNLRVAFEAHGPRPLSDNMIRQVLPGESSVHYFAVRCRSLYHVA
jgi:2-cysteine adaptor domain